MATWDNKEREQFKIDAENLKNDIDAIQSQKIEGLRKYVEAIKVRVDFQNSEMKDFILSQEKQSFSFENSLNSLNADVVIIEDAIRSSEKQLKSILKTLSFYKKINLVLHGCLAGVILWILVNL